MMPHSPKRAQHWLDKSTEKREKKCPMSVDSTEHSELVNDARAFEVYLAWKRKLLIAMQSLDPLGVLESGIFQQYEQTFTSYEAEPITKKVAKRENVHKVTDFQTVLQRYEISRDCTVTQLERRSHSCDAKGKIRSGSNDELRNVEFVLWNNAFVQANQEKYSVLTAQEELLEIKSKRDNEQAEREMHRLNKELANKQLQNSRLKERIVELQGNQPRKGNNQSSNETDDYHLQFLLKEKQLHKKLQEARDEIEELRNLLQRANDQPSSSAVPATMPAKENIKKDSLSLLRSRVENEGRMRRALQQLWGNELQNECNE